jgi:hypothetical protein
MSNLTDAQLKQLREFLVSKNLTFKPLLEEMIDHLSCDLEERLENGMSFQEAWSQSLNDLPENHFQVLQKQTMETIHKRFTLSRSISFMSLVLLLASVAFKVFHFAFSNELLFASFITIGISLLLSSISGIYLNKEKKGAIRVLAVIAGVIILLTAYSFKILHLRGASGLVTAAVIVLFVALVVNTLYVYRHASGEGNLLTYLHEKYTPGIERFLLILLLAITLYKVTSLLTNTDNFIGTLILIMVIFGASLQFIAMVWRNIEENAMQRSPIRLVALFLSFTSLMLVFLGPLISLEFRIVLVILFSVVTGWLAFQIDAESNKIISRIFIVLIPAIFLTSGLLKLGMLPTSTGRIIFNIPVVLILCMGLFLCRKNTPMRTYLIISFSSYLAEYTN